MNVVDCLLMFEQEEQIDCLITDESCDIVTVRVIVSELLSWMKLQYKRVLWIESGKKTSLKPMELNMSYPWCQIICKYVENQTLFNDVFEVKDNKLDFKANISEEYISYAYKTAYEKYNPKMIV